MPAPDPIRHSAVLLAAGRSARLGRAKQLVEVDGEPLILRTARALIATGACETIVVLGHEAGSMRAALAGLPVRTVVIQAIDEGMSASLRAAIESIDADARGALVALCDQPSLDAGHLVELRDAWLRDPTRAVASGYAGTLGVPALLPRGWFGRILRLRGDAGARSLLRERTDDVAIVPAPALAFDLDEPGDLARLVPEPAGTDGDSGVA